jgi:hypothetical protein
LAICFCRATIPLEGIVSPIGNHEGRTMQLAHPPVKVCGLSILLAFFGAAAAVPQPPGPPPPDKYKVAIRYQINAGRDQHVAQYKAMIEHLDSIGFEFEPKLKPFPNSDYEDPSKNSLAGFIAWDRALRCLADPSVASLLLIPANFQVPEDPAQPVRVRLELASGFPAARQLVLANQVKALLTQLGFQESVGYDRRGYTGKPFTRIVGSIPAGNLNTLLNDLRIDSGTLPAPVNQVVPIVVTEVLPQPALAQKAVAPTKRGQDYLDKISPDLWTMVTGKDDDSKIVRAEIILSFVPIVGDESYRDALMREAPSMFIEGRLGPVVTALLRVNQVSGLAGLPQVSVVRLPRPALVQIDPTVIFPGDNALALKLSGLDTLHQRGLKGQGVRVGIIDSDFRGYANFVKDGKLPKTTRLVDLTTEFNPDLYPDPQPGDDKTIGHGTHCALAAALAAPDAELTLIRLDPASLLQLQLVAKIINGEPILDAHLTQRADELRTGAQILTGSREEIIRERKPILDNYEDDSEYKRVYDILGPAVRGWLFTPREWHLRRVQDLERETQLQRQLDGRFDRFFDALKSLKGLQVVCTSLVWNDGYPLGGASPLSQWFEDNQHHKALWFVSVGNTQGQNWSGPYRDVDGNGVMEFTGATSKLPPGVWTPELNFLAWQPHQAPTTLELPEGATVRITMQWQEPHDPSYYWNPKERDRYLKPLGDVALMVLRQSDPSGKLLPADDFEFVARSPVAAFRIDNRPTGSTYEQTVEFTVKKSGRYALRVEQRQPSRWELRTDEATKSAVLAEIAVPTTKGIRPADAPNLPAIETQWEMRPRIFVAVVDPANAATGRVVFRDFTTQQGSIPILADTRALISVGAANFGDQPQPYSAFGTPGNLWNFTKPNVLSYDSLTVTPPGMGTAYGASISTPFATGTAATLLSAGMRPQQLKEQLQRLNCTPWRLGN